MKFTKIFTTSFFLLTLIIGIGIASYFYISLEKILINRIHSHLETAAYTKANQINIFLQSKKDRAVDFSSDGFIKNSLHKIKNSVDVAETAKELTRHLIINKLPADEYFLEVFALDTMGIMVSSTNDGVPVGFDFFLMIYFI